ncbi:glycosyl hydrolase family 18 protein [Nitrosospira sp. Nsp13]|uniref:glycosyl hydrolase family 18 protein n=1 Tax=Nitrosospira sp. Nsp13 TaxID=1855332 RepID=UPI000883E76A|nr:glycosyl hydrolase family 18 protein [Nitrosospira sp. Nsp13]SCY17058.1 Glycosyl hydrolases family 18 [Nitrosospira sp. Nsp13]
MQKSDQPPFASKLPPMNSAWIFLNEDQPSGTNYNDPSSQFQRMIKKDIYQCSDMISLCFVDIVPTSANTIPAGDGSSYTMFLDKVTHPASPDGSVPTNQDYMEWIVRDAKKANPKVRVLLTLLYGKQRLIAQIYSDPANPDQTSAKAFAKNVVTYLKHYNLDGFDIDWEWDYLSTDTTQAQFKATFSAVGPALKAEGMLLTMGPATQDNLDPETVNNHFDIIAFQMYSSTFLPSAFIDFGIKPDAFAYGAKLEAGFQTADNAHQQMQQYGFKAVTTWRLNSENYVYEQDQYLTLAKLVFG